MTLFKENLLLKYRWMASKRTDGHKWEEHGRHDHHPCKYCHEDRFPFTFSRGMECNLLSFLLPSFEAEDLTQTTGEGGSPPTAIARSGRFGCFWGPIEICAKDDESDGDRAVACLRNGALNGMQVYFKCML